MSQKCSNRILITGSNGFVGTNLYEAFHMDFQLYGLDINSYSRFSKNQLLNWNELKKIPDVDIIIHLAGKAHDTENATDEEEYFNINVGLTKKIFSYFLKSGAEKFIFFSSVKAVTDEVKGAFLTEEDMPLPQTPYGKSKLEAEKYLLSHILPPKKRLYILRPCMIHGPGNKGNLNLLFNLVKKGIPYPLGAFQNQRSFTSIENLNFVIKQLIEKDIPSGVYQMADDETISTNEIIRQIAISREKKERIWKINKGLIKTLVKIGDLFHLPLNNERLKKMTESYVVSNRKIKNALGIDEMPVTAIDGMKFTLSSFSKGGK